MVLKLPECGCDQYLPRSVLNMLWPAVSSHPGTLLQLTVRSSKQLQRVCVCLLLQDLLQSCSRGGEEES